MSPKRIKNVAASVRQRLLNYAHERGEEFGLVLSRYAAERFLYRLTQSEHRDRFVLKGALLFLIWEGELHRMTRDLDLLGYGESEIASLEQAVRDICHTEVPEDGMRFLADTVRGRRIREDQEYEGIRIMVEARLGTARVPLQIDVGFGDIITPPAERETYPTILDMEAPEPRVYPRETVLAEKFQAMVQLGIANSRMKDFYDVWFLARSFAFEGKRLAEAVRQTFERRRTSVPVEPPLALTRAFAEHPAKSQQWAAFLRKGRLEADAVTLEEIVAFIAPFLIEPAIALATQKTFEMDWPPGGPWQEKRQR